MFRRIYNALIPILFSPQESWSRLPIELKQVIICFSLEQWSGLDLLIHRNTLALVSKEFRNIVKQAGCKERIQKILQKKDWTVGPMSRDTCKYIVGSWKQYLIITLHVSYPHIMIDTHIMIDGSTKVFALPNHLIILTSTINPQKGISYSYRGTIYKNDYGPMHVIYDGPLPDYNSLRGTYVAETVAGLVIWDWYNRCLLRLENKELKVLRSSSVYPFKYLVLSVHLCYEYFVINKQLFPWNSNNQEELSIGYFSDIVTTGGQISIFIGKNNHEIMAVKGKRKLWEKSAFVIGERITVEVFGDMMLWNRKILHIGTGDVLYLLKDGEELVAITRRTDDDGFLLHF